MAQIGIRALAQLCRRTGTSLQAGLEARRVWEKEAERGGYTQKFYLSEVSRRVAAGQSVAVSTQYTGTVTGVDLSGSEPLLQVGSSYLTISQIRSIQRPSSGDVSARSP